MTWKTLRDTFIEALFPDRCPGCEKILHTPDEKRRHICEKCHNALSFYNSFFCARCMRRLPTPQKTCHKEEQLVLASALSFENPTTRNIIYHLKYKNTKNIPLVISSILETYCHLIADGIREFGDAVIVPIPLHPKKERARGFNQSRTIANMLGNILHVPLNTELLSKVKYTHSQTEMKNYTERKENVAESFMVNIPELIYGRNIILVDDVFTSGATMHEAARILKEAGAKKILGFTLARV